MRPWNATRFGLLATFATFAALATFTLSSCQSAPPQRVNRPQGRHAPPPTPPVRGHKVVLLSLDGMGAVELRERWRAGEFGVGGFDRFFREGAVAEALHPVEPTLTAVNHIALATGFPPRSTGIVGNSFHLDGTPWLDRTSGFAAAIGTETIWEAARRQGKRTGILTFPGADGTGDRRRGDFGVSYSSRAAAPSEIVEGESPLARGEWRSELAVLPDGQSGLRWRTALSQGQTYRGALYPTPAYPADFADAVQAAGTYWPGTPDEPRLDEWIFGGSGEKGFDATLWVDQVERFSTFFFDLFRLAARRGGWELLLGYVPTIDETGHKLLLVDSRQPGYSETKSASFARERRRVWQRVDRELASFLTTLDLRTTAVILVSDHGMVPIHTRIQPRAILAAAGLYRQGENRAVDPESRAISWSDGGVANIYLAPNFSEPAASGSDVRKAAIDDLASRFSALSAHGEPAIDKVLRREDLAEHGLDHSNSGDLVVFAAPGFTFDEDEFPNGAALAPTDVYGMHGHRRGPPRLDAAYLELGAGVVRRGSIPALSTLEVAARVARHLGIEPPVRSLASLPPKP